MGVSITIVTFHLTMQYNQYVTTKFQDFGYRCPTDYNRIVVIERCFLSRFFLSYPSDQLRYGVDLSIEITQK